MSENTKTEDQKPRAGAFWLVFAVLAIVVYLTGLTIPLLGPDEPRYSQVAREMFERGDWVTPTLGGFDWFEKPALLYWLQIASYNLFGVTEFAARFGSALFGLGTVFCLWLLGRKRSAAGGRQSAENAENQSPQPKTVNPNSDFANWLALVAASTLGIVVFARGASFDIILTFPITAAMVSFFIFDSTQSRADAETRSYAKYSALFSFYFFIGVALIAKGLVGIVFPLAIVAFYYLLSRKFPPKAFILSLFWGIPAAALTASAWYLPMYRVNGWKFIDEFFIQHHFQRYTSNKYLHPQPFYFFFWVLPLMTLPWLPFFFGTLWKLIKEAFRSKNANAAKNVDNLSASASPLLLFAVAWLLVPLVFFSVSGSKLPGYILPAVPAAIVLSAHGVRRFVRNSRARQIFVKSLAVATLVVVALLAQFFVSDFLHEETVKHLVEKAAARGLKNEKILGLHTVSHSAEFYGAGRLVREADGKQKRLFGVSEVVEEMKKANAAQALVLIPVGYVNQLTNSGLIEAEVLGDNGDLAIALVKMK